MTTFGHRPTDDAHQHQTISSISKWESREIPAYIWAPGLVALAVVVFVMIYPLLPATAPVVADKPPAPSAGFDGGLCRAGQADATRVYNTNANWHHIVQMGDIEATYSGSHRVDCSARVILSDAQQGTLVYSFTRDPAFPNISIEVQLQGNSLEPYP